jgi:ribosomal protein S12 methylthiotransferase
LLYAYPERLDDRLVETVAREKKICKYLDIPLQHGSDKVLRMMGRSLTGEKALALLKKLRREIPGVTLRSTFIVGFPGEGESEFGELLSFLAEARLDRAGFFMFSREEGTPAAGFPGQVDDEVKQERLLRAEALQSRILDEKNRLLHGQVLEAMVDGPSAQDLGVTLARTAGQAPEVDGYVRLRGTLRPGGLTVRVRITGSEGVDLLGEIVST